MTLSLRDIERAESDSSLLHVNKFADHYIVSVHDDHKSVTYGTQLTSTVGYVQRNAEGYWHWRYELDTPWSIVGYRTRIRAVKQLLHIVGRRLAS